MERWNVGALERCKYRPTKYRSLNTITKDLVGMTIQEFMPGLGMGELTPPMADSWASIAERHVYIIVGVTGVGKSTTIEAF